MKGTATRSESLLRPREIQTRIRAGQSPETVAAAAQTSVDRVMVFATPVLAERAFVAQQAAKASVRRRVTDGTVGRLAEAVSSRLESVGSDPDAAEWDAWRREDGRWTVVTSWVERGEARQAQFTYDAMGRYVVADDDDARWLVGERVAEPAQAPFPAVQSAADHPDPTADQTDPTADQAGQLALGDDALQVVTGRPRSSLRAVAGADMPPMTDEPPAPQVAAATVEEVRAAVRADVEPTEDLTETVRAVRAVGAPSDGPSGAPGAAPTGAPDSTGPAGDVLFEDTGLRAPDAAPATATGSRSDRRTARSAGARSRRSMPSWDDIVLGSAPRGD